MFGDVHVSRPCRWSLVIKVIPTIFSSTSGPRAAFVFLFRLASMRRRPPRAAHRGPAPHRGREQKHLPSGKRISIVSPVPSSPRPLSADRDTPSKDYELFGAADDMHQRATALSGAAGETVDIATIPNLEEW